MNRSLRFDVWLALLILPLAACGGGGEKTGDAEPPAQAAVAERLAVAKPPAMGAATWGEPGTGVDLASSATDDLERARGLYEEAKHAILSDDLEGGVSLLEQIVVLDPEFGEAWYQLGAALANQAVRLVAADEEAAIEKFDAGVAAKKTAQERMNRGALRVWDAFELRQAQEDLDAGLADADAVRADRETLIAALYLHAATQGYVQAEPAPEESEPGGEEVP